MSPADRAALDLLGRLRERGVRVELGAAPDRIRWRCARPLTPEEAQAIRAAKPGLLAVLSNAPSAPPAGPPAPPDGTDGTCGASVIVADARRAAAGDRSAMPDLAALSDRLLAAGAHLHLAPGGRAVEVRGAALAAALADEVRRLEPRIVALLRAARERRLRSVRGRE